jgi:hypothetical protein
MNRFAGLGPVQSIAAVIPIYDLFIADLSISASVPNQLYGCYKRAEPLLGALHRILDEPVSQRAFIHLAGQSSRQLRHDINMLRHLIRREPLATMSK